MMTIYSMIHWNSPSQSACNKLDHLLTLIYWGWGGEVTVIRQPHCFHPVTAGRETLCNYEKKQLDIHIWNSRLLKGSEARSLMVINLVTVSVEAAGLESFIWVVGLSRPILAIRLERAQKTTVY
jgi:hypothetical protein